MKNRILCVAMAAFTAIGMISCGNPAEPELIYVTQDNVDEYIVNIGKVENLTVHAELNETTDCDVAEYAEHYYENLAHKTPALLDSKGQIIPMTDEAISRLESDVYGTVNEFMVFVKESMNEYTEYEYKCNVYAEALDQIIDSTEFSELPEGLIKAQVNKIEDDYLEAAGSYGLTLEQYLTVCATSLEELSDIYAKKELVIMKIAKEQGITADDPAEISDAVCEYLYSVTNVK